MPRKGGKLTRTEGAMAEAFAMTGNKRFTAYAAGVSENSNAVGKALQRPAVQAEIARIQQERLFSEALPAAVQCLISIATDPKAAAGARVQASKVILDRTLGIDEAMKGKEPHEMTPDELAKAIEQLQRLASDKARPIVELEAIDEGVEGDVFG
jgi:hypothetical protein